MHLVFIFDVLFTATVIVFGLFWIVVAAAFLTWIIKKILNRLE